MPVIKPDANGRPSIYAPFKRFAEFFDHCEEQAIVSSQDMQRLLQQYEGTPFENVKYDIGVKSAIAAVNIKPFFDNILAPSEKSVTVGYGGVIPTGEKLRKDVGDLVWKRADEIRKQAVTIMPGIDRDGLEKVTVVFSRNIPEGQFVVLQYKQEWIKAGGMNGRTIGSIKNDQYDTWRQVGGTWDHVGTLRWLEYYDQHCGEDDANVSVSLHEDALPVASYSPGSEHWNADGEYGDWERVIFAPLPSDDTFPSGRRNIR